ncbi:MAG: group II intron reverse transcriptase/maturase [Chryseolinea sp.]
MDVHVRRVVPISYEMVAKAYQKVRKGGKSPGVDEESWAEFESKGVERELYVIWNRMASGSYFPQAVKRIEIPKKDGSTRKLGIPTMRDRIAQEVVRDYMEKRIDIKFHEHSYGYRPTKSSHEALKQVRENISEKDWVVDMDISKFFDEIDHELMLKAVEAMMEEKWVLMYVKRWLEMKVQTANGELVEHQGKGTPQGGVISPLLANLYLHYSLDQWLAKHYPSVSFVRYADDIVLHCATEKEAQELLKALKERLTEVKLRLNEAKTKIVYCKDYRRKALHDKTQFGFLGFSFQPRTAPSKINVGSSYVVFTGEISRENQKKIRDEIRTCITWRNTTLDPQAIATKLNSKLRGWINYFGLFGKRHLRNTMLYLDGRLLKWLMRKHKVGSRAAKSILAALHDQQPNLFYHWTRRMTTYKRIIRAV